MWKCESVKLLNHLRSLYATYSPNADPIFAQKMECCLYIELIIIILIMWKMANDEAPNNISIRFYSSDRLGIRAEVPTSPTSTQSSLITKQYNSFAGLATRLWNTLPKKWILLEDWKISRFFWGSDWSVFLTGHLCRGTADKITIQFWNGPGGLFVRGMFDWADTIYVDIWRLLQSYKVTNILCW